MFIQAYLQTGEQLLEAYKGEEPLPSFLKKYFAQHKKFGSRDRKQIAHLCYSFFRLGKALPEVPVREKILAGLFLTSNETNAILQAAAPRWNEMISAGMDDKVEEIKKQYSFDVIHIFSFKAQLSSEISLEDLSQSILQQPPAHIRIRPGKKEIVVKKLAAAGITVNELNDACIAVPPATKLDAILNLNAEAVVQDSSSQKVLQPLIDYVRSGKTPVSCWDCCAASGGKSILLNDYFPQVQLTVSDVRESILANLRKRFEQAGIKNYNWFVADIASGKSLPQQNFGLVLCDAPCSGSGTWSRTPEQLYFFKEERISEYASLQKKIAATAAKALEKGGLLLYITCSVFKEENEEVVRFLEESTSLKIVSMQYFKGYHLKADTLFAALLQFN